MKLPIKAGSVFVVSALSVALIGATRVPDLPMSAGAAMIYNPGDGDYAGFRIVVEPTGLAKATDGAGNARSELQSDLVQKFFEDLRAVGALDQLPTQPCAADQSDASTTVEVNAAIIVSWRGKHSPALRCVTDPRAVKLLLDATTIQHALYVQAYRKRTMLVYGGYVGGGTGYQPGNYSDGHFYAGRFYNDRFTNDRFVNDRFTQDRFTDSRFTMDRLSSGMSPGSAPFSSLPSASLSGGLPGSSLPFSNPTTSTPYGGLPNGGGPYSGGP